MVQPRRHGTRGFAVRPVGWPWELVGAEVGDDDPLGALDDARGSAAPPAERVASDVLPRGWARPLVEPPPEV